MAYEQEKDVLVRDLGSFGDGMKAEIRAYAGGEPKLCIFKESKTLRQFKVLRITVKEAKAVNAFLTEFFTDETGA